MSPSALLQVRLERGQLSGPQSVRLREPGSEPRNRLGPQAVDADAGIELVALFLDETTPAQHPQMAAHGRKGKTHCLCQLPRPMRSLAQEIDDTPAMRIGKGGKCAIEVGRAHV